LVQRTWLRVHAKNASKRVKLVDLLVWGEMKEPKNFGEVSNDFRKESRKLRTSLGTQKLSHH